MSDLIKLKKSKSTTKRLIYLININTFPFPFQKGSDRLNSRPNMNDFLRHVNLTSWFIWNLLKFVCLSEIIYLVVGTRWRHSPLNTMSLSEINQFHDVISCFIFNQIKKLWKLYRINSIGKFTKKYFIMNKREYLKKMILQVLM